MVSKYIKKIVILLIIAGCTSQAKLIEQNNIRIMEREDHNFCLSQGLSVSEINSIGTELYWECRLAVIESRRIPGKVYGKDVMANSKISKLSKEVAVKLNDVKRVNYEKFKETDNFDHHEKCLKSILEYSGKDSFGARQSEISLQEALNSDQYYKCRRKLVVADAENKKSMEAEYEEFLSQFDFFKKDKNTDKDKIDKKVNIEEKAINLEITKINELLVKYPECQVFRVNTEEFNNCAVMKDKKNKCYKDAPRLVTKKRDDMAKFCIAEADKQFPDVAIEDPRYSKAKLIKLRESFIEKCKEIRSEELEKYSKDLVKNCDNGIFDSDTKSDSQAKK